VVVVTVAYSDQELLRAAVDRLDSDDFVAGIDVLIDASKSAATISPVEVGQLINVPKKGCSDRETVDMLWW